MNRKLLVILPLVAFVALAGFFLRGLGLNPREVPSPLIGKAAPGFERPVLHALDRTFTPQELRGQVWLLNVWASWCAPCRTEMPLLQRAADTYAGRAVILGIASKDDHAAAAAFLDDLDITYPNVFDQSGQIRVALGLNAYPTTYVFGTDGTIRARVDGGVSEQRLAALIEDALR